MDVEAFIRDQRLGESVVGKRLDSLIYPPDVDIAKTIPARSKDLTVAPDMTDYAFVGEV